MSIKNLKNQEEPEAQEDYLLNKIFQKLQLLNLVYIDKSSSISIINIASNLTQAFIFSEISYFISPELAENPHFQNIFIDVCIGEYLQILYNSCLIKDITDFDLNYSVELEDTQEDAKQDVTEDTQEDKDTVLENLPEDTSTSTSQLNFQNIKTIKEGDTSITYFEPSELSSSANTGDASNSISSLINYFLSKKSLFYNYKVISW